MKMNKAMDCGLLTDDFEGYLKFKGKTNQTIASYQKSLRHLQDWLNKEQMSEEQTSYTDLLSFIKRLQSKEVSQRTINTYFVGIAHYFDYLLDQGAIVINPTTDIKIRGVITKKLHHILEPHELHNLYNNYIVKGNSPADSRNKCILGLLVYQGVTTTELSKLETNHLKLREGKIDIPGGRKSEFRILDLVPAQMMELYDYALQIRPQLLKGSLTNQWFISEGGHSDMHNYMARILRQIKKQNPIVKNARQIRASVITKWLKQHNLRETQYRAGHRYISSTEAYQQNDMEELSEEIGQYHPF